MRSLAHLGLGAVVWAGLTATAWAQAGPRFETAPLELVVALVEDPQFPPLDERLVQEALRSAEQEFARRFDVAPPRLKVQYRYEVSRFLSIYSVPSDPLCNKQFAARYRGTGSKELTPHKEKALKFFRRWSIESLRGFAPEESRAQILSYEDVYELYAHHYVDKIEQMKALKTPAGTPLLEPNASWDRSFVAWLCALQRQDDFDVLITNTFIVSDLLTEPHPHSVFGKAKIGGIAAPSEARHALGGQALLATTFGVDTEIPELNEIANKKPTLQQRARLLGAYLLAHEIAHAVFGIPDVYDHPLGCLMTSRPGATYLDGLEELDAHPLPCEKCRPYVKARSLFDRGRAALARGDAKAASRLFVGSVKSTPRHFHGGRKKRLSKVTLASSEAQQSLGKAKRALRYAKIAAKLDPRSLAAQTRLKKLQPTFTLGSNTITLVSTASTSTTSR